jgi:hypothetical protein
LLPSPGQACWQYSRRKRPSLTRISEGLTELNRLRRELGSTVACDVHGGRTLCETEASTCCSTNDRTCPPCGKGALRPNHPALALVWHS